MPTEANLGIAETDLALPEVPATAGNDGYRIGSLLKDTGAVTYDPGFANTASTSSSITYIDGDAGVLQYRGYPIEQLADKSNFVEVCYLLIHGELPTQEQYDAFDARLRKHTIVHE
ncbi:citrate (Si)-synthase, partial [Mycobacterium tuberculosis]|nr:citrate (Si)-synthase [Mycobacterium tuberculosis]